MTTNSKLPLVLLYTNGGESIDGATRFQKLVFLAQQETNLSDIYSYHADKYGPFSPELHKDLEALRVDGYIEKNIVTNEVGNEKYVYSLTPNGISSAKDLLTDSNKGVFDIATDIKQEYNDKPLQELLRYVYRKYDDYATASELDLDRLFDPDARSQFLEEDREYIGTKPGEWKEVNPSAEEFFSTN